MDTISNSKRRKKLLKEARKFAVRCHAEVALVIITADGERYEFTTCSAQETVDRYIEAGEIQASKSNAEGTGEHVPKDIDALKLRARKLLGKDIAEMSYLDAQLLGLQLETGVNYMKDRVDELLNEEVSDEDSRNI